MAKSTTKKPAKKPEKPWADFPLFPHAAGYWAKKIRGRMCYFGSWSDDPEGTAALQQFKDQEQDLKAGRPVQSQLETGGRTLKLLCNRFMDAKERAVQAGGLHPRTFGEYHLTCKRLIEFFGRTKGALSITIEDFAKYRAQLAERLGHVALANEIQRVRSVFIFAHESQLIPARMVFGPEFVKPSKRTMRIAESAKPQKTFTAEEIRKLLKIASEQLRAMILLGINAGFGNNDVAMLTMKAVDLERGIIDFPRPKTGVARRVTLWPETVKALKAARQFEDERTAKRAARAKKSEVPPDEVEPAKKTKRRTEDASTLESAIEGMKRTAARMTKSGAAAFLGIPANVPVDPPADPPADAPNTADLFFRTKYGAPWTQHGQDKRDSAVGKEFAKLLTTAGMKRPGASFYGLRHTFATIAGATQDIPAIYRIMGHHDPKIGAVYTHWHKDAREDARLKAVTDAVRKWLFPRAVQK